MSRCNTYHIPHTADQPLANLRAPGPSTAMADYPAAAPGLKDGCNSVARSQTAEEVAGGHMFAADLYEQTIADVSACVRDVLVKGQ